MKLSEMWVKKETDVWLHLLNKDGAESGKRDARRFYGSKQQAIGHLLPKSADPKKWLDAKIVMMKTKAYTHSRTKRISTALT